MDTIKAEDRQRALDDLNAMRGYCPDHYDENRQCQIEAAMFVRDHFDTIRAALQSPAVPEGWKLVPVEPTTDMTWKGAHFIPLMPDHEDEYDMHELADAARNIYKAMLSAAPEHESGV